MELSPWNKLLNDEACVGERDISCQGSSCEGKHGFPHQHPSAAPGSGSRPALGGIMWVWKGKKP